MTLRKNETHARNAHVDAHTPAAGTASSGTRPADGHEPSHEPMSAGQRALLKQLSQEAYEPEAFDPTLTRTEAALRIRALEAKLANLSEPPHTA
jgi:hypothetical protein